ncbi:hypothetical protein INT46_005316 [Mucor plumbeus]|uniref:Uncharacterized protein n=1 Tax=Mucor plumbeus TaxID=97098 RepID=A0A8H7UZI2_9FUNG|nr:hypothetical protein INT46_005316 [Mucor plumbeus]
MLSNTNDNIYLQFVSDKLNVDWNILLDALDKARVKESENEVKRLSYKRRKLHLDLHSEANNQVEQLIIEGTSLNNTQNNIKNDTQSDDVFSSGEPFDIVSIKNQIRIWRENASRIDQLAKQDLLFYNILDFTNKSQKSALKNILKEHYTIFKHYINKLHSYNVDIKTDIQEEQFRDETNTFTDTTINERHFIMCFVYPLIQLIFNGFSKKKISQRWGGEAKLVCSKEEENQALETDARRASGSSIDAIIELNQLNRLELIIIEVTGGSTGNNHEHYLEDKNKIGKNLKKMLKAIILLQLVP